VSGFPPFDLETGEIVKAPIERQAEIVLAQRKLWVETAGSSLANVLKCNAYCSSVEKCAALNAFLMRAFSRSTHRRACLPVCRPGLAL